MMSAFPINAAAISDDGKRIAIAYEYDEKAQLADVVAPVENEADQPAPAEPGSPGDIPPQNPFHHQPPEEDEDAQRLMTKIDLFSFDPLSGEGALQHQCGTHGAKINLDVNLCF
jgi:hypothetical protein